jgi:hypothetical protein
VSADGSCDELEFETEEHLRWIQALVKTGPSKILRREFRIFVIS